MQFVVTLAKVAAGYIGARGLGKNGEQPGGGGAQVPAKAAEAAPTGEAEPDRRLGERLSDGLDRVRDIRDRIEKGEGRDMVKSALARRAEERGYDLDRIRDRWGRDVGGAEAPDADADVAPAAAVMAVALDGAAELSGKSVGSLLDAFNETGVVTHEAETSAALMLRAMIQAAKADGHIDPQERQQIIDHVGADADAEDLSFVKEQLDAPVDIAALAADTPEALRVRVYSMSLMSVRLDTPAEAVYLDRLAAALGLDQTVINALHDHLGLAPLYR